MKKRFVLIVALFISCVTFAQQDATINITGQASKMVIPDKAIFSLHISANRKSEPESFKAMTEISNEVLNRLKKEGFTESQIKLADYSVQVEYDYSSGKPKKSGYISSQSLIVKFPIDKRKILSLYAKLTADEMEGLSISFGSECSDSLKAKIQNELIVLSLNDAKQKAELIAVTTETKIKSVADVSYKVFTNPMYPPMMSSHFGSMKAENAVGPASDFFSLNEIEFTEEIKVTYWIQNLH